MHTRSLKYGKLREGILIDVPTTLVKRSKVHFISLPFGVDLILGVNGKLFIRPHLPDLTMEQVEADSELLYSNKTKVRYTCLAVLNTTNSDRVYHLQSDPSWGGCTTVSGFLRAILSKSMRYRSPLRMNRRWRMISSNSLMLKRPHQSLNSCVLS